MTKINLPNSVVTGIIASGDITGTTDTTTLNAALAAARIAGGGVVRGVAGSTYTISSYLIIGSNVTLDMTGCNIVLVANANSGNGTNMLRNYSYNTPTATGTASMSYNSNTVTSAVSVSVGQTVAIGQGGNQAGGNGNGPLVGNVVSVGSGTFTINTLDGRSALCTNSSGVTSTLITVYNRDQNVRVIGGTWNRGSNPGSGYATAHSLLLRHIDSLTIDIENMIATGGKYGVAPAGVTNFFIRIKNGSSTSSIFQMNGPAWNGRIDYIGCSSQYDDICPLTAGDYSSEQDTAGDIIGVDIGTVTGTSTGANSVKLIAGAGRIVDGIRVGIVSGSVLLNGVWIGDDAGSVSTTGGTYGTIDIGLVDMSVCTSGSPVALYSPSIEHLRIKVSHRISGSTRPAVALLGSSTVTINELIVEGETSGISTVAVQASNSNMTVNQLVMNNFRHNPTTVGLAMVDVHHATVVSDIVLNDCVCAATAILVEGNIATRIHVKDGTYTGTGANFYTDLTGASVVMALEGCSLTGMARVALVTGTLTTILSNAFLGTFSAVPFYASGGTLTVLGNAYYTAGTTLLGRAASEALRCNGADLPCNQAILTPSTGDQCSNTTSTTAVPTGKVVYDGSRWRSLQTPASLASGASTLAVGTVSVANTAITANSLVRLTNIGTGGTIGVLAAALTAGTGFAINSSSNTDTSKVFWEVVQY